MKRLETVDEDAECSFVEVRLPSLIPMVPKPELDRETGERRRRGRDILIAIDHGPNSKHAFDWALIHLCRLADTIHLVHAIADMNNSIVYEMTEGLLEKLAIEAFHVAMVKTQAKIVQGDPGKVLCHEANRLKPAAVVMGTRSRGLLKRSYRIDGFLLCLILCSISILSLTLSLFSWIHIKCAARKLRRVLFPPLQTTNYNRARGSCGKSTAVEESVIVRRQ